MDRPQDVLKLYEGLPKALAAVLIQLRSGKIALASYLYKIKKVLQPWCECHQGNQTVAHILEECPQFAKQRKREFGRPVVWGVRDILSDPKTAKKAAWFTLKTGLLDQFRVVRQRLIID